MTSWSAFDFTGDYPIPSEEPEKVKNIDGYDAKVDYLMNVIGLERDQAERLAEEIEMDDAA